MPNGEEYNREDRYTQGEIIRTVKRIEQKVDDSGASYATKDDLKAYRELADYEHKQMRDELAAMRDGLRWSFRGIITILGTGLFGLVIYVVEQAIRTHP